MQLPASFSEDHLPQRLNDCVDNECLDPLPVVLDRTADHRRPLRAVSDRGSEPVRDHLPERDGAELVAVLGVDLVDYIVEGYFADLCFDLHRDSSFQIL